MLFIPPLKAEVLYEIAGWPVTNTMVNALLVTILFAIFAFFVGKGIKKYYTEDRAPKGVLNFFEAILEFLLGYIDGVTKDRKNSLKFLPIVGGLFLFILISNWIGLLPGTGSVGFWHGEELVPLFRPANTDLNLTLAMAIAAVVISHFFGIITIGFFKYTNKFIKLGDLYKAAKSLNPIKMMVAFIEFFVGFIEVFSEVAKMVSLSLRLFGNIFAGEVLLTVIGSLIAGYGAFFIPLPFMALEIIVGVVQATVFSMLTLVYLTIATTPIVDHNHEKHEGKAVEGLPPAI